MKYCKVIRKNSESRTGVPNMVGYGSGNFGKIHSPRCSINAFMKATCDG